MVVAWYYVLTIIGRAGGGGTSSGGGGGGGGGRLSGLHIHTIEEAYAVAIMFLIHMVFLGIWLLLRWLGVPKKVALGALVTLGLTASLLVLIMVKSVEFAIAFFLYYVIFGILLGMPGVEYNLIPSLKYREDNEETLPVVQQAAAADPIWDAASIKDYATQVFHRFQYDWSHYNTEAIRAYTTQKYANHIELMLYAMQQMGRQNLVQDVQLKSAHLSDAYDSDDDTKDRFSIAFRAQANDQLLDVSSGQILMTDTSEFMETWHFQRDGSTWRLGGITQATEEPGFIEQSLERFAADNQMYFSPDWGRLLLPTRGELFAHSFTRSDVNNHIIGFWTGNLLVQMYTYCVDIRSRSGIFYLVGQITLPKSYGGILIRRQKSGWRSAKVPAGYKQVTLEWGDFNRRYTVHATREDQVTSFELLNPSFMAWLYDQNLQVDIEVVDNVVYLYSLVPPSDSHYAEMLEVLKRSHKELER